MGEENIDISAASVTVSVEFTNSSGYGNRTRYFGALKLPIDPFSSPEDRQRTFKALFAEVRRAVGREALADAKEAQFGSTNGRKDGVLG